MARIFVGNSSDKTNPVMEGVFLALSAIALGSSAYMMPPTIQMVLAVVLLVIAVIIDRLKSGSGRPVMFSFPVMGCWFFTAFGLGDPLPESVNWALLGIFLVVALPIIISQFRDPAGDAGGIVLGLFTAAFVTGAVYLLIEKAREYGGWSLIFVVIFGLLTWTTILFAERNSGRAGVFAVNLLILFFVIYTVADSFLPINDSAMSTAQ